MKRILKIIGILLLIVLLGIGAFAAYIHFKGIPKYQVEIPESIKTLKVEATPERIQNGARIASMTCVQCHRGKDGKLTGNVLADAPKEFGFIHSANITQHPERGIGSWTDGELLYLLRTSVKRDGSYAPPWMPAFPRMSDEDIYSIIAWLRSDDQLLQASDAIAPDPRPSFLSKALSNFVFKPFPFPTQPIPAPDTTNVVAWGKYLADDIYACYGCHSADFKSNDEVTPSKSAGYYGGGNPLLNLDGEVIPSSNITMHATGIAHYTKEQFIQAVRWGKKPDGTSVRYPMVPHTALSDNEVGAIYEFIKTVPPLDHSVPATDAGK